MHLETITLTRVFDVQRRALHTIFGFEAGPLERESPGVGVVHALCGVFALACATPMLTDDPAQ